MPLKLKPTVLDRLKELEGDAKAKRISEALPILASGITPEPKDVCICAHEVASTGLGYVLDKTLGEIRYALEHGVVTLKPYGSNVCLITSCEYSRPIPVPGEETVEYTVMITLIGYSNDVILYKFNYKANEEPDELKYYPYRT